MSIINAIILGLIQGVAEFLPISASGHMSIVQNLFGLSGASEIHAFYDVLLHLAALISVCLVFRQDLADLFNDCITLFTAQDAKLRDKSRLGARQVLMLVVSTLPLLLVLPLYDKLAQLRAGTIFVGLTLILTGTMLYVSDRFLPGKKDAKSITIIDALIIGVCQCVATLPGMSRADTVITAGMCCGVDKEYALKYSFLLAIPSMLGGTILSIVRLFSYGVDWRFVPAYFIGTAISLVTGVLSINVLQLMVKNKMFGTFRYYCWGAGVITIILTAIL